ncbi:MAG TPA: glucosamine-6-phosphate deaminase [Candidatus Dormibacteraeota bacterium]|nr:glucosamine-6-phosphate deaminase [Candidatus Dormibacteraeota bacterium]
MVIKICSDSTSLGKAAALEAAAAIRHAIANRGAARIIAATGASQFEFLEDLTAAHTVDWEKVEMFHLDEYVGLSIEHPASFRKYLLERLIQKIGIKKYTLLDGEADPEEACRNVGRALTAAPIDVAFVGIGENGHLAFNDPPADFETEEPYRIVRLDEACRRQQVGEGWFETLAEVPKKAISMTIRQILKSRSILCVVPDARKAKAVKLCFEGEIGPMAPASILRTHPNTTVFLDLDSARLLKAGVLSGNAI